MLTVKDIARQKLIWNPTKQRNTRAAPIVQMGRLGMRGWRVAQRLKIGITTHNPPE